jgi:hypothetical protein
VKRCRSLRKLRLALWNRLSRLEKRLHQARAAGSLQDRDLVVAYVAVEALNAWTLFCRSFYLSCAFGARTKEANQNNCTDRGPSGPRYLTLQEISKAEQ